MQTQFDLLVFLADLGQAMVPVLSLAAYLPQWRKLLKTRQSGSVSAVSWGIWSLSSVLAMFYAIVQLHRTGYGVALVFSSVLSLCFVLITFALVYRFRQPVAAPVVA